MAEMRIGVANGGALPMNGVSGVGTGRQAAAQVPQAAPAPVAGAAGALVGAVEAGVPAAGAAQPPVQAAQAAWQPTPQAAPAAPAAAAPMGQSPQVAPYAPPNTAAAPPAGYKPYAATDAVSTSSDNTASTSTSLSSSSAAAIAVPLVVVALAILLLAALIWYKRHPTRNDGSLDRRRSWREKDSLSISEKALVEIPGYGESQSRSGSVRSSSSSTVRSLRGVTVVPHIESPTITRPPPSVAPSIASIRRPTSMNITKPLPPISEYGGSVRSSGSSAITQSTIPVIHSATVGRRADAQFVNSPHTRSPMGPRSTHPTIVEETEHTGGSEHDGGDEAYLSSSTAPSSPRARLRSKQGVNYFSTNRLSSSSIGGIPRQSPPAGSVYSIHSAPVPRQKAKGHSRRPIPQSVYSYTQSLPASIARNAPVSTVRRPRTEAPALAHSPQSTCESESLPEIVDFPPGHPFAQKYSASSASSSGKSARKSVRAYENDDTESMIRSITAHTELTLPWGFAEAKGGKKDGVKPLRQETASSGAKLFREETRKGADWARERQYQINPECIC